MNRLKKVKIEWSPKFAYAIGLITTDGNLSCDNRHINMTSKDKELIETFKECLGISNKVGKKSRGGSTLKKYFQVQFGDKNFYLFLLSIGLTPAKSKTLKSLNIPDKYFSDFLRGCFDGDGTIGTFKHPESKYPQLRVRFFSASPHFLKWIKDKISYNIGINSGWIGVGNRVQILAYGKEDSIKVLNFMYYQGVKHYLDRKNKIAQPFLRV